jgi:hypothetical protein
VAPILTYESGPTKLGEQLSLPDLGAALTAFERLAADTITAGGGQIVTVHEPPQRAEWRRGPGDRGHRTLRAAA